MKSQFRQIIRAQGPECTKKMDTQALISNYTCKDLFAEGEFRMSYWEVDRALLGGVIPISEPIVAPRFDYLASDYICQRREMGVLNLGGAGTVKIDGEDFSLETHDALYVGKGSQDLEFSSLDAANPAIYYLLSYPAHSEHPSMHIKASDVEPLELGSPNESNERSLYKMICPGVLESCQLVMGFTVLKPGSVWNTMPPHTHDRRSEVYLYFDMPDEKAVMHFMGEPTETRHLVLRNFEASLSPNWSIHCGAGVGNYSFVWGMGGENQDFADMDHLSVSNLL